MANDCAASIKACAMRVARLAADGTTPAGASNMYIHDNFARLLAAPQVEEGNEITVPNACGRNVVSYKDADKITRLNLTLELITPDPELLELLASALLIQTAGSTVGFAYPKLNESIVQNGVSLEVWSQAVIGGSPAAGLPYWRWVFPKTYNWRFGDREWSNAAMPNTLTGIAIENTGFGNGPTGDWTGPTDRVLATMREAAIPNVSCGYQATPVQA